MDMRLGAVVPAVLLLAACTHNPPAPTDHIAVAEDAVRRAEQRRAGELAPAQLDLARRKLREARERVAREDRARYDEARRLAEQAAVDAQLAESQADTRSVTRSGQGVRRGLDAGQGRDVDDALAP